MHSLRYGHDVEVVYAYMEEARGTKGDDGGADIAV